MSGKQSKLSAVYGVHDGSCIVSGQECVLCHFKVHNQPQKVQDLLYKWMVMDEKPESTTDKQRDAWARKVSRLPAKQREYLNTFAEAVAPEDSVWKTKGQGKGLVSDIDVSDEPLPVQRICWELLSLIQAGDPADETKNGGSEDDEFHDWKMKAENLPTEQQKVVRDFSSSLKWVWLKKDELSGKYADSFGGMYGNNTMDKPVSVAIH